MPHQQIAHQIKVVADYIRVHVAQYGTEAIDRQLHILDVNHSTLIGTASAASTNHSAAIVAQINFNRIYCNEKIHRNILSGITQTPSLTSTQQSPEPNYLEFIPLRVWLKKPGGGAWTADDIGDCIFEIELSTRKVKVLPNPHIPRSLRSSTSKKVKLQQQQQLKSLIRSSKARIHILPLPTSWMTRGNPTYFFHLFIKKT